MSQAHLPQGLGQWWEKKTPGCKEVRRAEVRRVGGRMQEWVKGHTPTH